MDNPDSSPSITQAPGEPDSTSPTNPVGERLITTESAGSKETPIDIVYPHGDKKLLSKGAHGATYIVSVPIPGEEPMSLVHKELFYDVGKRFKLREQYDEAKRIGLDVPPIYRVTEKGILMTDYTENGKNLVLSTNDMSISKLLELRTQHPELMRQFDELDLDEAFTHYEEQLNIAARGKFQFNDDDCWLFVLKPNGEYQIAPTDFENTIKNSSDQESTIDRKNRWYLKTFQNDMKSIQS